MQTATPKKVLIVDDEKFVTDTLGVFLKGKGYSVFKAEDGETTLSLIKQETPDLVLLDIKLPGISGVEILQFLRQNYPQTKVVVMTAYDMEYKSKIDEIGCDAFFVKPLLIDELTASIEELLLKGKSLSQPTPQKITQISDFQNSQLAASQDSLPRARILIVSPRALVSEMLKDYFSQRESCGGIYEVFESGLEQIEHIKTLKPEVILFDVAFVGMLGEFGANLMNFPHPPKEIILFGDPSLKWEEVEILTKRGLTFVEISENLRDERYPVRETILRLNNALKQACLKYGLIDKEAR